GCWFFVHGGHPKNKATTAGLSILLSTRPSEEEWETRRWREGYNKPGRILGTDHPTSFFAEWRTLPGSIGGKGMRCSLLTIVFGAVAVGGMTLAQHDEHGKGGDYVKVLSQRDIIEKLDGKKAKATMVEVTLAPGQVEAAHRHPGPAFGYILEG